MTTYTECDGCGKILPLGALPFCQVVIDGETFDICVLCVAHEKSKWEPIQHAQSTFSSLTDQHAGPHTPPE